MSTAKKIGIILILIGICLPTATMPFITEFKPVPELCLTSNFFKNMGNMMVVLGAGTTDFTGQGPGSSFVMPYRYLFSAGVILACAGMAIIVLSSGRPSPGTG